MFSLLYIILLLHACEEEISVNAHEDNVIILSYFQVSHLDFFKKHIMEEMKAQINYQTCHVV